MTNIPYKKCNYEDNLKDLNIFIKESKNMDESFCGNFFYIPSYNIHLDSESFLYLNKKRLRIFKLINDNQLNSDILEKAVMEVFPICDRSEYVEEETGASQEPEEKKKYTNPQCNLFSTKKYKKRGRKGEKEKEGKISKIHTNLDLDNVLRTVQVHFISFIIDISNVIMESIFGKNKGLKFKDIDYDFKSKINYKNLEELSNYTIKDIVLKPISKKFSTFSSDYNKAIYAEAINECVWLKEFFNMKYYWLFNIYYNEGKALGKIIEIMGREFFLSNYIKSFSDLIKKNERGKEIFIKFTKEEYMRMIKANDITDNKYLFNIKIIK